VEIAKFVLTAIGTFISVFALSFTIFQYWRKKQDEKFDALKLSVNAAVTEEKGDRKEALERLSRRIEKLEEIVFSDIKGKLGSIEGELKGLKMTLSKIEDWFIRNTPAGGV
jgi:hypothetical protein